MSLCEYSLQRWLWVLQDLLLVCAVSLQLRHSCPVRTAVNITCYLAEPLCADLEPVFLDLTER